ncbi:MAG: hypothetical protein RBS56_04040 [Candidatus Gracilibacteria bacterium]|jgi:hypothetical protein|nr:hypothetical protein [Candidatus Gracilibacteria bacterium]
MIGKKEWFRRRRYGGWGIAPSKWQGWVYIAVVIGIFVLIQNLPLGDTKNNLIANAIFAVVVIADCLEIMFRLPMDEREKLHEAKAERNALWVMLTILIVGVFYETGMGLNTGIIEIDPVIIIAIIGATVVKAATHIYLEKKE